MNTKKDNLCKDNTHIFSYVPDRSHGLCKLLKFNQNQFIHFLKTTDISYASCLLHTVSCFTYSSPLKIVAICSSEMSDDFQHTTRYYIQETEFFITATVWTSNATYQVPCSLNQLSVKLEKPCRQEHMKNWAQHNLQCDIFYFLVACNFQRQVYFS